LLVAQGGGVEKGVCVDGTGAGDEMQGQALR